MTHLSCVMLSTPKPTIRRKYDAASRIEALRLTGESRSTQAAARALSINPKLLYQWQKTAQMPVAAALVSDITYLPLANGSWAYRCAVQDTWPASSS